MGIQNRITHADFKFCRTIKKEFNMSNSMHLKSVAVVLTLSAISLAAKAAQHPASSTQNLAPSTQPATDPNSAPGGQNSKADSCLWGDPNSYTAGQIAEALLAVEAKFTDIKIEYTLSSSSLKSSNSEQTKTQFVFARKMPEGWMYLSNRPFSQEMGKTESLADISTLVIYNGTTTLQYYNKSDSTVQSGQRRVEIFPGRNDRLMKHFVNNVHMSIWGFGDSYGNIIKENNFNVVDQIAVLRGYRTVKLAGSFSKGNGQMTLWICPELNFLPIKVEMIRLSDKTDTIRTLSDFIKLSNGLYYPRKVVFNDPNSKYWAEMAISYISIEPLAQDFFKPVLIDNTHVSDHVIHRSYTTSDVANKPQFPPRGAEKK
jgi:hypothetical protein